MERKGQGLHSKQRKRATGRGSIGSGFPAVFTSSVGDESYLDEDVHVGSTPSTKDVITVVDSSSGRRSKFIPADPSQMDAVA